MKHFKDIGFDIFRIWYEPFWKEDSITFFNINFKWINLKDKYQLHFSIEVLSCGIALNIFYK